MKIALILPANREVCPYVDIYISILQKNNIEYDIIYHNTRGFDNKGIGFNSIFSKSSSKFKKVFSYFLFSRFIKKNCREKRYDKVIVFTSQLAIFLSLFLQKKYLKNYIIDFRDISIEQKTPFLFSSVAEKARSLVVSSPGFIPYLPKKSKFVLCHNLHINLFDKLSFHKAKTVSFPIKVLTIGSIRDLQANIKVIDDLKNNEKFELKFVGTGPASKQIESYCVKNNIDNVSFEGFYLKEDEINYYLEADIINVFYPLTLAMTTSLSNRFYNALISKKPMLVTKKTIHEEYVQKYGLGLSLNWEDDIENQITKYFESVYNPESFDTNCQLTLTDIMEDMEKFKGNISDFFNIE